jgi:hypothetical protein
VRHRFSAKLTKAGMLYVVIVPAALTRAFGARRRVSVRVAVGDGAPFFATLLPRADGRHVLRLNATVRDGATEGHRVDVSLERADPDRPVAVPPDVEAALREAGVLEGWEAMPPGKREHILGWIEAAAFEATRTKRISLAVQYSGARREKDADRRARRG